MIRGAALGGQRAAFMKCPIGGFFSFFFFFNLFYSIDLNKKLSFFKFYQPSYLWYIFFLAVFHPSIYFPTAIYLSVE